MSWNIFTPQDFQTSHWAGGVTTQLAIGPQGTHYADRDFLWRISSAQVELDHSVFTHLAGLPPLPHRPGGRSWSCKPGAAPSCRSLP